MQSPIFNVPPVIVAAGGMMVGVHILSVVFPSIAEHRQWVGVLGFFPDDYFAVNFGDWWRAVFQRPWPFLSHALLHADLTHLLINLGFLLAFGGAVARSTSGFRFACFISVCAIGGAIAYYLWQPEARIPMIGASGGISGLMAGMIRLSTFQSRRLFSGSHAAPGISPLRSIAADTTTRNFILVFLGINGAQAIFGEFASGPNLIAWQGHIGGFVTGLLCVRIIVRSANPGTTDSQNS